MVQESTAGRPLRLMGLHGLMVSDLTLRDGKMEESHLLCPKEYGQARRWYTLHNDLSLADACTGLMHRVLKWTALQVTAGQGYISGTVAECAYRDAKGMAMAGTTVETARMAIADELLERY